AEPNPGRGSPRPDFSRKDEDTMRTPVILPPVAVVAIGVVLLSLANADDGPSQSGDEAARISEDAYIYGYPLVLMDVTRQVYTATPKVAERKAPANQFYHAKAFPDPSRTTVVSPNADTLYSIAWLDLSKEPMVLSVPEMGQRYFLM